MLDIRETANADDIEFLIRLKDDRSGLEALRSVQHEFENNDDYTDVLFYAYPNHEYKVIVKREHHADFLAALWKRRLLAGLEWTDDERMIHA